MGGERKGQQESAYISRILETARFLIGVNIESLTRHTLNGQRIDDYQVACEKLAISSTEVSAAEALTEYASTTQLNPLISDMAYAYASEVAARIINEAEFTIQFYPDQYQEYERLREGVKPFIKSRAADDLLCSIGQRVVERQGEIGLDTQDDLAEEFRNQVRGFTCDEVAPIAQKIHQEDQLVPEDLNGKMARFGFFSASIPREYGGTEKGPVSMVVLAEELSKGSLVVGSLVTRAEIIVNALLEGGTEDQRRKWLPALASGQLMTAVSVTEPDIGSDVASIECRATPGELDRRKGWFINGTKAWSTFAGRANVIAVLARTDLDKSKGAKGLSLFIVEKEPFFGHSFVQKQNEGGQIVGTANPTLGYRGMHSFTLAFDRYFVPEENLIGRENGLGQGFYLQMVGFNASRLQTAGRALGVSQAALEKLCYYLTHVEQIGHCEDLAQLDQHLVGAVATSLAAAKAFTYEAARRLSQERKERLYPAMAKILTGDVATYGTTQVTLKRTGFWGLSDESAVSRYAVDALVLPIFEGVKPVLELKIIARDLLSNAQV